LNGVRGFDSVADGGHSAGCGCSNHFISIPFNTIEETPLFLRGNQSGRPSHQPY
jgi:hypothetical protein